MVSRSAANPSDRSANDILREAPPATRMHGQDAIFGRRENPDIRLIETLRQRVVGTIGALVPPRTSVALLDFPRHFNVGDAAIWLGEIGVLSQCGVRARDIRYVCDMSTYDERSLRQSIPPSGVILLHGGGNFGDLWPRHQQFRESVVAAFPDRRIVILPQSVHFREESALHHAARLFNRHPSLTILARGDHSLDVLRRHFNASVHLCPDMAFCLGPVARAEPDCDVVYLARNDKEAVAERVGAGSQGPSTLQPCDWPQIDGVWQWRLGEAITRISAEHPRAASHLSRVVTVATRASYNSMARERVAAGCRLIAHGKVMIADRLHAHILALLMGVPHVVLDNSYGKISRFRETWTAESRLTRAANTREEAFEIARAMLRYEA